MGYVMLEKILTETTLKYECPWYSKKMLDSLKTNITLTQKVQPASERNASFFGTSETRVGANIS
jgi:hypothetical protein